MKKRENNEIDKGMIDFFLESNIEDLREMTAKDGFDLNKTLMKREKLSKKMKFLVTSKVNKDKNDSLYKKAEQLLNQIINIYIDKPVGELKSALIEKGLHVQFRNIEKFDEETVKQLLSEFDLVDIIEKLEEKNN